MNPKSSKVAIPSMLFVIINFLGSSLFVRGQTPLLLLNGTNLTVVPWGSVEKPWQKENATYSTIGQQCNFWLDLDLTTAPWPKGCWKYQYTDPCNQYEISFDGKSVDSCNINKDACPQRGQVVEPQCIEYYKNKTYATETSKGVKLRFPETSKRCFFTESLYPLKPWPVGCKLYQADDYCSSYEISDEGNYVISCDLAMITGECLSENTETNTCVEFCPEGGCVKDGARTLLMSIASSFSLILLAFYF